MPSSGYESTMQEAPLTLEDLRGPWPSGAVGYVALLGRPNAGKSTFLNTLLDYHLAAVSAKPQTTRRRWLGIYCETDCQILFLDTPGVHAHNLALGEEMRASIQRALSDADAIVVLTDAARTPGEEETMVAKIAAGAASPTMLAINKCDVADADQIAATRAFYADYLSKDVPVEQVCARQRDSVSPVLQWLREVLPQGPFLYSPDELSDATAREIGADLVREVVLEVLDDEVPHATAVTIESWEDGPRRAEVQATLHVERSSQKAIVVGRDGRTVGRIRREAQARLSEAFGPVRLSLWVKVSRNWRKHRSQVRDLTQ